MPNQQSGHSPFHRGIAPGDSEQALRLVTFGLGSPSGGKAAVPQLAAGLAIVDG
ncbi:hypothetical protein Afe04nite_38670 [Asanoa ferruginea]|nr:hypothetical protein Afe04nite_38670 [Asanoa ferruginea]